MYNWQLQFSITGKKHKWYFDGKVKDNLTKHEKNEKFKGKATEKGDKREAEGLYRDMGDKYVLD